MSILKKIVQEKVLEVRQAQERVSQARLIRLIPNLPATRKFSQTLKNPGSIALIAEIKKSSPSKGTIRTEFKPEEIARSYTEAGVSAISVLTDQKFFQGNLTYLQQVRLATKLPVLRKDFIISEYQIYESRCWGADAILLIAAILSDEELNRYLQLAHTLDLACLVEVHSAEELERVLKTSAQIIGINNRDLNTFRTTLETTYQLKTMIHDANKIVVSESGIHNPLDVQGLAQVGVNAILVGEALMRAQDIGAQVHLLMGRGSTHGEG